MRLPEIGVGQPSPHSFIVVNPHNTAINRSPWEYAAARPSGASRCSGGRLARAVPL